MANRRAQESLSATGTPVKPSHYPLGSPQSRAAARALLEFRRAEQGEGTLIVVRMVGRPEDPNERCTCRKPEAGTFAVCRCFL